MNSIKLLIPALALSFAMPLTAADKNGKKPAERGMLEKMDAVPCGANQRGLTGLGSLWGSVGLEHSHSDEKLCPEYLLRTDQTEYVIRSTAKHPAILPVGHEGEFRIKENVLYLKVPEGDNKMRAYQVVSIKPTQTESSLKESSDNPSDKPEQK